MNGRASIGITQNGKSALKKPKKKEHTDDDDDYLMQMGWGGSCGPLELGTYR